MFVFELIPSSPGETVEKSAEMTMKLPLPGGEGEIHLRDPNVIALVNMLSPSIADLVYGLESKKNKLGDQLMFVDALGKSKGTDLKIALIILETVDVRAKARPKVLSAVKEALESVKAALGKKTGYSIELSLKIIKARNLPAMMNFFQDGSRSDFSKMNAVEECAKRGWRAPLDKLKKQENKLAPCVKETLDTTLLKLVSAKDIAIVARKLARESEAYKLASLLLENAKPGQEFCFNEIIKACIKESYPRPLKILIEAPSLSHKMKMAVQGVLNNKKNWGNIPESMKDKLKVKPAVPSVKQSGQTHLSNQKTTLRR